MPFPEVKRVIYGKNPLRQVVCQLRFPPILRIDAEIPASFQERIRSAFPNYTEKSEMNLAVPEGVDVPAEVLRRVVQASGTKNYEFASEDGNWQVNLTRTFLALSTSRYRKWEDFRDMLLEPLNTLVIEYAPAYFSRIGLRYVDVIKRSTLGLENVDWNKLLKPHVLGVLSSVEVRDSVKDAEAQYEIGLADGKSVVRIITKLAKDSADGEIYFIIDSDFFYAERTKIEAAVDRLNFLNVRATNLIQWAITPLLHQAMEPEDL
jgi:uncharacterized protein (TIGR04255 family)